MKLEFTIDDPEVIKFFEKQKVLEEKKYGEKPTNAEIAKSLVHTGAFRRLAARRWAKENKPKTPAKKSAPKKVKGTKTIALRGGMKLTTKAKGPLARKQAAAKRSAPKKAKVPVIPPVPTPGEVAAADAGLSAPAID